MEIILVLSLIIMGTGFVQLVWSATQKKEFKSYAIGIGMVLWGAAVLLLSYWNSHYGMQFMMASVGVLMVWLGILMAVKTLQCKQSVPAVLLDYNFEYYRGRQTSYPVFRYSYEGKNYQNRSAQGLSKRRAQKRYEIGQTYDLYINEKDPNYCVVSRRIQWVEVLCLLIGLFMLYATVLMSLEG